MRIGIIVAMDKELAQLRPLIQEERTESQNGFTFHVGCIGANDIVATQCGIGKVNSAIGASRLIDKYAPDLIVSTGVAGGADVSLNVMDIVVATESCYHDVYCGKECATGQVLGMPVRFKSCERALQVALSMPRNTRIVGGLIVSGDQFIDSRVVMADILSRFPDAKAIDMESCSIAQTCHVMGVPFISMRIISDVPLKDTDASQYYDFWARLADGSFAATKSFLENL